MKIILLVLNAVHPRSAVQRIELRRMVAAWDSVRRDIEKALKALPELDPYLYDQEGRPSRLVAFVPEGSGFEIVPEPLESAGNGLYIIPPAHIPGVTPITKEELEKHRARVMFTRLLFNELRDSLAGPCLRCGQYFLLETERRKLYCSARCQRHDTAAKFTKNLNAAKHKAQLHRVRAKISEWDSLKRKPKKEWKQWVSEQLPEQANKRVEINGAYHAAVLVAITPKFITRAINKHELQPPKKEQ